MAQHNLSEDAILKLMEESCDDAEIEETPFEEEKNESSSDEEADDTDEDPDYDPGSEEDLADALQNDIRRVQEEIQALQNQSKKKTSARKHEENSRAALKKRKIANGGGRGDADQCETVRSTPVIPEKYSIINLPGNQVKVSWNKGRSEYFWDCNSSVQSGKIPQKNIVHIRPGPTPEAADKLESLSCFNLFFSKDIMNTILIHTNSEISRQRENYGENFKANMADTNIVELKALLGILVLSAALKDNHISTEMLFNTSYSGDRYKATMLEARFRFLINCLRFDDKDTRITRLAQNRLAPISEIWEYLMVDCEKYYKPGAYLTIDEQLVGFRGKCKFRMYIPSKPDKYGLKLIMMCDNGSKYMVKAIPYLGKGSTPISEPSADFFVKKLIQPIKGSNRNITMDNWFCSVPLVEKLLLEDNLTVVGTIKRNKPHFPKEFVDKKYQNRGPSSSIFLFHNDITVVSYMPNKKKLVTLISSLHGEKSINEDTYKPEIIMTYNSSKGAVDSFDQMCHAMNHNRKTKRWTLCLFYNMLNIVTVNSFVIYSFNYYKRNRDGICPLNRINFMLNLHQQLAEDWQKHRLQMTNINKPLRTAIQSVLGVQDENPQEKGPRKYCSVCPYTKRRHTTTYCLLSGKPVCLEHQKKICFSCANTCKK